MLYPLLCKISS